MSYDPRSKHHNDHRSGYWGRPNAHTAWFKRKDKYKKDRLSFSSNGFKVKSKDSLLFDSTGYYQDPSSHNDTNDFYRRGRFPRRDIDDYNNRDWPPYDDDDDDDDGRKNTFGRDCRPSLNSEKYDNNRNRRNNNFHDSESHRYDRRGRYGNYSNNDRYDNTSRSPSRVGGRESDLERSKDADKETFIPSERNIRTDYSIHQDGRLYSDLQAHIHPHHHHRSNSDQHQHAIFAARKGTPLSSRWDQEPTNTTRPTAIYQFRTDQSSSLQSPLCSVSPTTDIFRPSKAPKPETMTMPRPPCEERSPSHRPATVLSAASSRSTATSVTTTTAQGGFTNHVQHSHLTTRSTILQEHRRLERVQQKAQTRQLPRPRGCRSSLISTAAETCKALTSLRKQTGIITADISVTDLLGKRSVGRPSKVRLETEDAARLGINRAKLEMKAWEQYSNQQQLQVQGVVKETVITRARHRPDIFKVHGSGRIARLRISAAVTTTSSGSIFRHPQQIHVQRQQEIQPQSTRTLKTRKEWELLRQGQQDISEPKVVAPRRDVLRQILVAPAISPLIKTPKEKLALAKIFLAKPLPPKVIVRTDQPICSLAETNRETQNIEDNDGYLGSTRLECEYRMKGNIMDDELTTKSSPPQADAFSTSYAVPLEHDGRLFDTQRDSSSSEKIDQAHHSNNSRKKIWSGTSTVASTSYSGPMHPPSEIVCPRPMHYVKLAEHSCWKERSPIDLEKQPVTLLDRKPQSGDGDTSFGPRRSILKRKRSLIPSNQRRRVTFANSNPDIEYDSHYAANLSDLAGASLTLPVEVTDTHVLSPSVSPSPPPLAPFTPSSPAPIEEEVVVANKLSTSPASSSASVSSPISPSQGSPLSDSSSLNDDTDSATDCSSITNTSDSAAEVEEARRKVLAHGTNISLESDTALVSNAEGTIVMNAVDKQAEADAARKQAIERIKALPTTHTTQAAEVNRQPNTSLTETFFTPTPDYWNATPDPSQPDDAAAPGN
ncbi:hypothetical protein BGZ96_012100 [Linnemannia gamsii]|uniref:Btz domain-containing protein n=1 Tax=Linnemannia gamsii TaxID=64522 RepID=A0ABQ7JR10_9FUNG|nr:hypothetical protein BGZ96_012100 [Linnemannia gamsii]